MKRFSMLLLAAGAALAGPAGAQSVKAGISAWQKQDYAGAVTAWKPLAVRGDADAAFNLGQAYRLGKGVSPNLAEAQKWFEVAARKGHVDAATSLGILLFQNGNQVGAMRWLKLAAEAGEPRAMLLYGTALYNGDGVAADPTLAYAYVSRAAARGLEPAKATLADMDSMMPLERRKQGVAMAQAMVAKGRPEPAAKPVAARPVPPKPVAVPSAKPQVAKPAPPPPPPATARPRPTPVASAAGGGWRIQLGAFSSRHAAETLYGHLAGKLGGAGAYYIPVGAVIRLQAGPFSKQEAAAACARLRPQPCFPVKAP
ncbi:SPOR domain-containing protein [Sphingomonas sp. ASV193]|uniref:SPOR domain-containing protein n=1 Tax=Sphingomonas sp. ASV193 TaxID=3144405 RepID=UPI0032E8A8F9